MAKLRDRRKEKGIQRKRNQRGRLRKKNLINNSE